MAAKLIQITVSSVPSEDGEGVVDSLYGLDEKGVVWLYSEADARWEQLSTERYTGPTPGADEGDEGDES